MLNDGYILTAREMREAEEAIFERGTSVEQLMFLAGTTAAQQIWRISGLMPTLVACGPGNNGGDGYVIAQWLLEKGVDVRVGAAAEPATEAAAQARTAWMGETVSLDDAQPAPQFVDCLFGTGLTRPLTGKFLANLNRVANSAKRRIAIDLPSGIHSDNGTILSETPRFDHTLALGAYKPSHFLEPSRTQMGHVSGIDIGINAPSRMSVIHRPEIVGPATSDHKYSRGLVAVIAGKMPGAAHLAALSAQASGGGYVKIFGPAEHCSPSSSIVLETYDNEDGLKALLSDERLSAVVIGPGLGRGNNAGKILSLALAVDCPIVVDADALMIMGRNIVKLVAPRSAATLMTPHLGEFQAIREDPESCKLQELPKLTKKIGADILLKGPDTIVASLKGQLAINDRRCRWLSTAGSGDVLSGIAGARLASGSNSFAAACEAQWIHTRAAQLAGPAFTPERLIQNLPDALRECL